MTTDNWQKLTPSERLEARFKEFMSPQGVGFASPEVEQAYRQRVQMI